jgi:hypothetical protein
VWGRRACAIARASWRGTCSATRATASRRSRWGFLPVAHCRSRAKHYLTSSHRLSHLALPSECSLSCRWRRCCTRSTSRTTSTGPQVCSLGDAKSSLGDTKCSLGDAKSSLGDASSSSAVCKGGPGNSVDPRCWNRMTRRRGPPWRRKVRRVVCREHETCLSANGYKRNLLSVCSRRREP